MTATQTMRYQRRVARVAQERRERTERALAVALLLFMLVAFAIGGTMDYHDDQAELANWQELGVTIQRW